MKLRPTRISVFPNPWGVHPRSVVVRKTKTKDEKTGKEKEVELPLDPVTQVTHDAQGRFAGNCSKDFGVEGFIHDSPFVGCYPDAILEKEPNGDIRGRRQDTGYKYLGVSNRETAPHQLAAELATREPLNLRYSEYYDDALRTGQLLCGDKATALALGIDFFEEPKTLFPKLSEAAAKWFNETTYDGAPAYEEFVGRRDLAANPPAEEESAKVVDAGGPGTVPGKVESGGAPLKLGTKTGSAEPAPGSVELPKS